MSLKINKDNIYVVVPNNKYNSFETIGDFMENNFTIFVRVKIEKESLTKNEESFIIARNGKHAGISVIMDDDENQIINFTYWLKPSLFRQVKYALPKEIQGKFNNLIMKCNMTEKIISCYVNQIHAGDISFNEHEKESYQDTFIWVGSCSMSLSENEEDRNFGTFDYELMFLTTQNMSIKDIIIVYQNYKEKYINYDSEYGLPILNDKIPNREYFKMFCDFKDKTEYKVWNMIDNGNYLQRYIYNHIYF